jgi:hypothetical protein
VLKAVRNAVRCNRLFQNFHTDPLLSFAVSWETEDDGLEFDAWPHFITARRSS